MKNFISDKVRWCKWKGQPMTQKLENKFNFFFLWRRNALLKATVVKKSGLQNKLFPISSKIPAALILKVNQNQQSEIWKSPVHGAFGGHSLMIWSRKWNFFASLTQNFGLKNYTAPDLIQQGVLGQFFGYIWPYLRQ